jgi:hypothetical protein
VNAPTLDVTLRKSLPSAATDERACEPPAKSCSTASPGAARTALSEAAHAERFEGCLDTTEDSGPAARRQAGRPRAGRDARAVDPWSELHSTVSRAQQSMRRVPHVCPRSIMTKIRKHTMHGESPATRGACCQV